MTVPPEPDGRDELSGLTDRGDMPLAGQVVVMLSMGLDEAEVGRRCHIDERDVLALAAAALDALHVTSTAEAALALAGSASTGTAAPHPGRAGTGTDPPPRPSAARSGAPGLDQGR